MSTVLQRVSACTVTIFAGLFGLYADGMAGRDRVARQCRQVLPITFGRSANGCSIPLVNTNQSPGKIVRPLKTMFVAQVIAERGQKLMQQVKIETPELRGIRKAFEVIGRHENLLWGNNVLMLKRVMYVGSPSV